MTPIAPTRRHFLHSAAALAAAHGLNLQGGLSEAKAATATTGNEICRMDAVTLVHAIRRKQLSPVEVTDAVLARMDKLEPTLHAFCTPTPEVARQKAKRIESDIMARRYAGPLAGVPVGIKDVVFTRGIKTTSGSYVYKEYVPDEDDVVVERLKAAGAVIIGKTNVPEFAYIGTGYNMIFPETRNPWNTERTTGGSSAGSGAAVAAGMGPFAIGTDGGGSIRIPSALCGLFGFKPSMGRVPLYPGTRDERYPGVSSWESIEHIGPMSRTVADAALMMSVISGPDDRDRASLPEANFKWMDVLRGGLKGKRVAYSADWGYARVDPAVREVIDKAVRVFEKDLGCTVEIANPGFDNQGGDFSSLIMLETDLKGMRALVEKYESHMTPDLVRAVRARYTDEQLTGAVMNRKAVVNKLWRFMRKYDLLLTPTVAVPAFGLGIPGPETIDGEKVAPWDWAPFTYLFNMSGQPAASVPAGFTRDSLPVGLQIVGRHLDDAMVLRAAAAFEAAAPWKDKWPRMLTEIGL